MFFLYELYAHELINFIVLSFNNKKKNKNLKIKLKRPKADMYNYIKIKIKRPKADMYNYVKIEVILFFFLAHILTVDIWFLFCALSALLA